MGIPEHADQIGIAIGLGPPQPFSHKSVRGCDVHVADVQVDVADGPTHLVVTDHQDFKKVFIK